VPIAATSGKSEPRPQWVRNGASAKLKVAGRWRLKQAAIHAEQAQQVSALEFHSLPDLDSILTEGWSLSAQ
jgi:hypothetical protein